MILHQPRTLTDVEQTSYFSVDLAGRDLFSAEAKERLQLREPMTSSGSPISGGVNSSGAQPLIQQFPVRPFNDTTVDIG